MGGRQLYGGLFDFAAAAAELWRGSESKMAVGFGNSHVTREDVER